MILYVPPPLLFFGKNHLQVLENVSLVPSFPHLVFCSGSAEKSSKKVVEIFGSLVKSPYFCTRFRERNPGARVQRENYINEEDRKIRYSVCFLR